MTTTDKPKANNNIAEETRIKTLIDTWADAIRSKDVNRRILNYAPDVLLFDVVDPLQYVGSDAIRKRALEWFSSFSGPLGFETRDLTIAVDNNVAFSHSLNHVNGTKTDGNKLDMWWRATVCYRKIDGEWMVTHEHNSTSFDPATGKASLALKPPK